MSEDYERQWDLFRKKVPSWQYMSDENKVSYLVRNDYPISIDLWTKISVEKRFHYLDRYNVNIHYTRKWLIEHPLAQSYIDYGHVYPADYLTEMGLSDYEEWQKKGESIERWQQKRELDKKREMMQIREKLLQDMEFVRLRIGESSKEFVWEKDAITDVTRSGLLELSDVPALRTPPDRSGGALGNYLIVELIPYYDAIPVFETDDIVRDLVIDMINDMYISIRNKIFREIGDPSPSVADYGKVPKESGALRRTMRASVSRNNVIIPNKSTDPSHIRLAVWLWANIPYAREVSQMATNKVVQSSSPAVQHPFPFNTRANYSRRTGLKKVDMGARNDYFDEILRIGRREAENTWRRLPFLQQFFKIRIGTNNTGYGYIHKVSG